MLKVNERINMKDPMGDKHKQQSRELIWKTFARLRHPPLSHVLMMPGSERYELDVVLQHGYPLQHVYLVEKSAAVLANFTRRHMPGKKSYGKPFPPRENILRMYLSQAATALLERNIRLDACHIDFCSHCESGEMLAEAHKFVHSGVLKDDAYLAMTFLAGREKNVEELEMNGLGFEVSHYDEKGKPLDMFRGFSDTDKGRIRHVWASLGYDVTVRQFGRYQNRATNNPLLWLLCHVKKQTIQPQPVRTT